MPIRDELHRFVDVSPSKHLALLGMVLTSSGDPAAPGHRDAATRVRIVAPYPPPREDLHRLVDAIPDDRLTEAVANLEPVMDPVTRALLMAPEDDEPLTEEDLAAIAEARADRAHGDVVKDEDLDREMGW